MSSVPGNSLCCFTACVLLLTGAAGAADQNGYEARRTRLLQTLTSREMLQGDIDSGDYAYRRRWQYYHACLSKGERLEEANRYLATSEEIVPDEWPTLLYIRTYFQFKNTVLSPAARRRLRSVLETYFERRFENAESQNPERYGATGNHSITAYSAYLLISQDLGRGKKRTIARQRFVNWVRYQGRFGRDEVNSPHYLDRSLLPLLNLYDFAEEEQVRTWAGMAIDQLAAEFALMSLDNVRGGPWCRAHHRHSPGVAEINDGKQDALFVAGYLWFGGSPPPAYLFTDQILSYGALITTRYRPPDAVVRLADRRGRGVYELKGRRRSVESAPSPGPVDWDMYYYVTPRYSLASLQDRVPLDNHVTGRVTRDYKNTQVWELTFSDPMKILGPRRSLMVTTGEAKTVVEPENPNTANMQYKNVLFYKGEWMDYNGNLASDGGQYKVERRGDRQFHFWRISTPDGDVYAGVTHFPPAGAGVLEVGAGKSAKDFEAFQRDIKDNPCVCRDTGLFTNYTSRQGDRIVYDHGKGAVNGEPWPLHGYPLYESPYMNAAWGEGVIRIAKDGRRLLLDFRDTDRPTRKAQ